MKRSFLSEREAAGRTIESVEPIDDEYHLILLSEDGVLCLHAGTYSEDEAYVEVSYPCGLELVRKGHLAIDDALAYRLIDDADASHLRAQADAKAASIRESRRKMYEDLKKEFGE